MFWSCDALAFFWNSITSLTSQCLHVPVALSPRLCLLGTSMSDNWNEYQCIYIDLAMLAARKCITLNWKESKPPVLVHWWNELSSYLTLDKIYYKSKGRSSDFLKIWQSHLEFDFKNFLSQCKA